MESISLFGLLVVDANHTWVTVLTTAATTAMYPSRSAASARNIVFLVVFTTAATPTKLGSSIHVEVVTTTLALTLNTRQPSTFAVDETTRIRNQLLVPAVVTLTPHLTCSRVAISATSCTVV